MKIALVGPSVRQKGGIVSVLKGLASYLDGIDVRVMLIATTDERGRFWGMWRYATALFSIFLTCLLGGCDVVHFHMASRGSCARKSILALVCILFRTPYIIHLHGGKFQDFFDNQLGEFGRRIVRFIFRRAIFVIALSNTWKIWIDGNICSDNTKVLSNGVSSAPMRESSDCEKRTILFLGRLSENKGVGELIAAARDLLSVFPDVIFEFGGDGELERYSKEVADLASVKLLGWLNDSARTEALSRASIFCLPSWNEGLPMSILEAMAVGLPVISTPVGGIPEAVEDGVTGLLVSPGDTAALSAALAKLLSDDELAESMGEKGRARQQIAFSQESMGAECVALYKRCKKAAERNES